jgi:hypothetical protein
VDLLERYKLTTDESTKREGRGGGQRGGKGRNRRTPRCGIVRRSDGSTEGTAGGRGGRGDRSHNGSRHPHGTSRSLELDVFRKRGKRISPTEYTFGESFVNGGEDAKAKVEV